MCGPSVAWDLIVLDLAYFIVLVGGAMVLRARSAPPLAWIAFGLVSAFVGSGLFVATYGTQSAMAAMSSGTDATQMLAGC